MHLKHWDIKWGNQMQWVKLGEFIKQCDERNVDLQYDVSAVKGISISKKMIDTKADMTGVPLKAYKVVKPSEFCFVTITSRNGEKISIAMNEGDNTYIVSSSYEVFCIKDTNALLPEYLYLWFCRPDFDRYARYHSWGSAREAFSYDEMCRIEIPLPSIDEQKQVVAAWRGLKNLKEQNEQLSGPLMDLCQSYLQELKHKYPLVEIGPYIAQKSTKNTDDKITDVYGVSVTRNFITASTTVDKTKLKNYKIVNKQDIAYVPTTHLHIYAIAISDKDAPFVVSPIYEVFGVTKKDELLPEYLFLWLNRKETERFAYYNSWGSARENFNFPDMCRVKIPLPPIEIQRAIVEIYNCARTSKYISETAKKLNSDICPALMRQIIGDNQ